MALLEILVYPNSLLREPAKPVERIDDSIQQAIDDMAETMYAAPGVGLAATQVGIDKSVIVYDISPGDGQRQLQVLINPRIISSEGETVSEDEGCLSVPDLRSDVKRAASVVVEGMDRDGNPRRIDAEGFLAVVLQHEIDHLNGKLFIDRISTLKRELYKRHIKKKSRPK
jgi:peptide deformylase